MLSKSNKSLKFRGFSYYDLTLQYKWNEKKKCWTDSSLSGPNLKRAGFDAKGISREQGPMLRESQESRVRCSGNLKRAGFDAQGISREQDSMIRESQESRVRLSGNLKRAGFDARGISSNIVRCASTDPGYCQLLGYCTYCVSGSWLRPWERGAKKLQFFTWQIEKFNLYRKCASV